MDLDLDISFVLPAVLFTVLAIVLASTFLNKKPAPASKSKAKDVDDAPIKRTDEYVERKVEVTEVPPVVDHKDEEFKAEEKIATGGKTEKEESDAVAVAPVVEEIGVVEEQPMTESDITPAHQTDIQEPVLEPVSKPTSVEDPIPAKESAPEPAPAKESAPEPAPAKESAPEPAPAKESAPEPAPAKESAPEPAPAKESAPVPAPAKLPTPDPVLEATPEPVPAPTPIPETVLENAIQDPLPEKKAVEPVQLKEEMVVEHNEVAAAGVEKTDAPLKYVPGKLRTSHFEKMMTKEELEAEQRVQQEQLAAIFQLLRENKETFGEVTEGEVEEQLRLYSI